MTRSVASCSIAVVIVSVLIGRCATPERTPAASEVQSSGPSASAAFASCETSQLDITVGNPGGGLGTAGAWLRFVNRDTAPCQLHGWPRLRGVTAAGVATLARQTDAVLTFPLTRGAPMVVLAPGDAAVAAFAGSDNAEGVCPPPYHSLEVTPPDSAASVTLSGFNAWLGRDTPSCAGLVVTMVISAADVPYLASSAQP